MLKNGIKPVFVFDGKPPEFKSGELAKRRKKKKEAEEKLNEAKETGQTEDIEKFSKQVVRVTPKHNEECKKLLRLMGMPVIEAPCEAEAQCAELARGGKVYAAGSDDMDTLTLGTPILLRHLTYADALKKPIVEIHLEKALNVSICLFCICLFAYVLRFVGAWIEQRGVY
jgi:flap endonuclease-1